jgi:hypothetical protein
VARLAPRLSFVAASVTGAGLAALVLATGIWPPESGAKPLRLPPLALRDNKQRLSAAETATLLRWASRFHTCAVRRGAALDPPTVGENEIVVTGPHGAHIGRAAARRSLACSLEVGTPPRFSALVLARDRVFHLYRPRTCRLPVVGER